MKVNRASEPAYSGATTFRKVPLVLDPKDLEADVAIVGAPMDDFVTNRPGARYGPRAIRLAYEGGGDPELWSMDLGVDPFAELRVVDHGDAEVYPGDGRRSHASIAKMVAAVCESGAVPIVLGGDHSISYPDIEAVAARHESGSLAVVHFDTHTDTAQKNWDVEWSHGTPFYNLIERGVIRGDRLVQVGIRGYWPFKKEFDWARSMGVRWHRMETIQERGIDAVVADVLEAVAGVQHLFLSVDIDVLDPAFAPGTGTPEPGGLSSRELLRAVRTLVLEHGLVGMDVVEVSPPYDHADITALAAHAVVLEALSALAVHRRGGEPRPEDPQASQAP